MTVNDLKENMACTIISAKKDKKYESKTVIRKIERNTVYVDATIYKGKVVNLNGVSNHLTIDIKSQEPQVFQYVYPEICRKSGKIYYKIDLKNRQSTKFNRRRNFRCPVGKSVSVRMDGNAETYTCNLKDISAVGFALEFPKRDLPQNYKDIKTFRCVFTDVNKIHDIRLTAELNGIVRRVVETDDGKILFGCQMKYSYKVDQYVAEKQKIKQHHIR